MENAANSSEGPKDNILDMDIDQLAKAEVVVPSMDVEVTTLGREKSTIGRSPAAVFVITSEMIHRSGATSIPELLRMAPGMEVARINANQWAVTARGFNGPYAAKLLVLVDGRCQYSPVYAGVHWDTLDVLLEDIDRIEVIRGPGGTLWGTNAVNGIINIITKSAKDTQGSYATAGGGSEERFQSAARYGQRLGENGYYRVYAKDFERDAGSADRETGDDWRQGRFGFRADWELGANKADTLTVQGDHYVGESGYGNNGGPPNLTIYDDTRVTGQNVLGRLQHIVNEDSDWTLQAYYDKYFRRGDQYLETVNTYDIDFQHRFALGERHEIIWGGGYRGMASEMFDSHLMPGPATPASENTYLLGAFIQDEIELAPDLWAFVIGTKLERNVFTGWEVQPTARLLFTPDRQHAVWGAISRAVRIPSLGENLSFGGPLDPGGPSPPPPPPPSGFLSEELIAYEIGMREQMTDDFSWDLALFWNDYMHLQSMPIGPQPPDLALGDPSPADDSGQGYGAELAGNWQMSKRCLLRAAYTFLRMHVSSVDADGPSPRNQVYLQSSWDLTERIQFDVVGRYVDSLAVYNVPSYITMDLRLGWRPSKAWELALVGQNLLSPHHLEFGSGPSSRYLVSEVDRGVYATVTWRH